MPRGTRNYIENNNTLSGNTPGSPITVDFPLLPGIIHNHELQCKIANGTPATEAQVRAAFERFSILLNNGTHSEYFVDDVLAMNTFYGHAFVDGFLTQFFSQDFREDSGQAEIHAFVPGAHRNPRLRIFTKAGHAITDISHHLEVEGLRDSGRTVVATQPAKAARPLVRYDPETIVLTDTGDVPTKIPYDANTQYIRSLNFKGANITRIAIMVNGVEKYNYDSLPRLNERLKQSRAVAVPQADTWHINFELLGSSSDAVLQPEYKRVNAQNQVIQAFPRDEIELRIYASDNTSVRLLAELYDTPDARAV